MEKVCPRCTSTFRCRVDRVDLCECQKISLAQGVRDFVKDSYEACLCPSCLHAVNASFNAFGVNPKYRKQKES